MSTTVNSTLTLNIATWSLLLPNTYLSPAIDTGSGSDVGPVFGVGSDCPASAPRSGFDASFLVPVIPTLGFHDLNPDASCIRGCFR